MSINIETTEDFNTQALEQCLSHFYNLADTGGLVPTAQYDCVVTNTAWYMHEESGGGVIAEHYWCEPIGGESFGITSHYWNQVRQVLHG